MWFNGLIGQAINDSFQVNKIIVIVLVRDGEEDKEIIQMMETQMTEVLKQTTNLLLREHDENTTFFKEMYSQKITFPSVFIFNSQGLQKIFVESQINQNDLTQSILQLIMMNAFSQQMGNQMNETQKQTNQVPQMPEKNQNETTEMKQNENVQQQKETKDLKQTNEVKEVKQTQKIVKEQKEMKQNNNQMNKTKEMKQPNQQNSKYVNEMKMEEYRRNLQRKEQEERELKEQRENEILEREFQKQRKEDMEYRKRVLEQVNRDKEMKLQQQKRMEEKMKAEQIEKERIKEENKKKVHILFRLPDGETRREMFEKTDRLQDVYNYVMNIGFETFVLFNRMKNIEYIDLEASLESLDFYPSITLHVLLKNVGVKVEPIYGSGKSSPEKKQTWYEWFKSWFV